MQNLKYFYLRQLSIIVELRVDVVNVAVQEEGEGGNVLEADKVRRGAYVAGEYEDLVELVVADCKCTALSFCGSPCLRPLLLPPGPTCTSLLCVAALLSPLTEKQLRYTS
jgi:hypothetical protein